MEKLVHRPVPKHRRTFFLRYHPFSLAFRSRFSRCCLVLVAWDSAFVAMPSFDFGPFELIVFCFPVVSVAIFFFFWRFATCLYPGSRLKTFLFIQIQLLESPTTNLLLTKSVTSYNYTVKQDRRFLKSALPPWPSKQKFLNASWKPRSQQPPSCRCLLLFLCYFCTLSATIITQLMRIEYFKIVYLFSYL